jgi:ABC-2 type transport system ATP-binding protein
MHQPAISPDTKLLPAPGNQNSGDLALELRNVTKFYGDFCAVDDVSFTLPSGGIYGFLGQNGAGKTTTLRMILDIIRPTRGAITILGRPSALEVRQRVGYLPEEKGLYKKMKTWAVIAYFATLKGLSRNEAKRRACELLERYGLKEFMNKPTDALSKGMGQKVQLLAAIAHEPELVILDEPFTGLDPVNQQVMEDIIRDMARQRRTVLFSTHVMEHAERLCDRILLMARGKKIFDGTTAEAKRLLPRRVRIETEDSIDSLRRLDEVVSISAFHPPGGPAQLNGFGHWELQLRENAEPQSILQHCFAERIRLHSFNQSDPTLHEVFVRLVSPPEKEAS